jgi:hypothetical protein
VLVPVLAERAADADGKVVLVDEGLVEQADTALALQQLLPGVFGVGRQGIARRHGGDDDVGQTVAGGLTRHGSPEFLRCAH